MEDSLVNVLPVFPASRTTCTGRYQKDKCHSSQYGDWMKNPSTSELNGSTWNSAIVVSKRQLGTDDLHG